MTTEHTTTTTPTLDLFVIGGGINGTGIANDAAGRGLKVGLCEQNDLASATSSASSKLIHGGLRYLEHYEFRLVREALHEREVLLKKAPHIVWPMRFILPHQSHLRPAWMLRAGLFLYDHLSSRDTLPGARSLRFGNDSPLKRDIKRGFEYSDCWVDDARMVVLNALQASQQGAEVLTRTRCIEAVEEDNEWVLTLENLVSGERVTRRARALVNAAGPWVEAFIRGNTKRTSRYGINMIKGSHIVTRRINRDERAYILQNEDKRIVFVLPWQGEYSLIGTTDVNYDGDPANITISEEETDYLLKVINDHFEAPISRDDIVTSYSGVRPLCDDESDDPSAMSRDYTLDLDSKGAPMLSVFGGKITTFRKLAEAAMAELAPWFPNMGEAWTADATMPGGAIPGRLEYARRLEQDYPFLGEERARRFASSYGALCEQFLRGVTSLEDLGEDFGGGMTRAEVDYLIDHEWALSVEDILWRRTKMDMHFDETQRQRLNAYVEERTVQKAEHPEPA
ncbi:glycerol-3-phosphate dehydrogenase [Kushneria phosphatilytica]|uniref:Glycerol-3-phosphate dehydrogenase n=1 Tax=Kushneria phosphatilytica TaxID=657387 RepID=A0A1S1NS58_9GAMM|nr:glycerol-3-phosphate dehydrogenase [Kushneria phosphatilytica]OHV12079.1 glycerol-3-phosphate dehydrogenase [Kushneria phosphatilytica]QEL11272.1 glycerol-3-phosphate dehydrogenase [Kushneria phosphatilytica]